MRRVLILFLSFLFAACQQDLRYTAPAPTIDVTKIVGTAMAEAKTSVALSVTPTPTVTITPTATFFPTVTPTATLTETEQCSIKFLQNKYDKSQGINPPAIVTRAEWVGGLCQLSLTFVNPVSRTVWDDTRMALKAIIANLVETDPNRLAVINLTSEADRNWDYQIGGWNGYAIGVVINVPNHEIRKRFTSIVTIRENNAKATLAALSSQTPTSTIIPSTTQTPPHLP